MQGYRITTNSSEFDFDCIYQFISTSYWAKNIPVSVVKKSIENSLCFALFTEDNQQVGFARMITDKATFAYLGDVFILDSYRGLGLSKYLLEFILAHPELQGLRRIMLATQDAHGLYQQFGFTALDEPESIMQIRNPRVYENNKD